MTKQTETKTPTQKLRAELKAAGFKPSAISVRKSSGGAIYVYIKDRGIALEAVEEIANGHEEIRRCVASGEILSGGNTFVFVEYAQKVKDEFAAMAEAIGEIPMGGEVVTPKGSLITRPHNATQNNEFGAHVVAGFYPEHIQNGKEYYTCVANAWTVRHAVERLHRTAQY